VTGWFLEPVVCILAVKKHLANCQVLDFLVGDAGFEPTAFGSGEVNKMQLIQ
jgi:hypothetical protein